MKLRDVCEAALYVELREAMQYKLAESVEDYLSKVVGLLKNKPAADLFKSGSPQVDLEKLAAVISGLKILGNEDYRDAMTKDDIGINPRSASELLKLLDGVPDTGKLPSEVSKVFSAIADIAPSAVEKVKAELEALKSDDQEARQAAVDAVAKFALKAAQVYNKVKHKASSSNDSQAKPAAS